MIRWKYVLPRITAMMLLAAGIRFGADPALEWGLCRGLQRSVGAQVDVGRLTTSLLRGSLQIDQLAVADPDAEFQNLVELDQAVFDVEMYSALRRKLVIRDGVVDGLRFHTARETSGRLDAVPEPIAEDHGPSITSALLSKVTGKLDSWFDQQVGQVQQELEENLQTVPLGRELAERWPQAYQDLESRALDVQHQGKQLREQIDRVGDDPLQHIDQVPVLVKSIDQLRRELAAGRQQLIDLQAQMQHDRQSLEEAKQHDEAYIRERLHLPAMDGESLTDYLLGPGLIEKIEVALQWLKRSREVLPLEETTVAVQPASRGVSVIFPGFAATPDLLIRQLRLTGSGSVNQQPFHFSGIVTDVTHQPRRHAQPIVVKIEATGGLQMRAQATLDRRHRRPIDQLVIDIPALRQNGQTLGDPRKLALTVSPGSVQIHADVQLNGNDLQGQVTLLQEGLELTPATGPDTNQLVSAESLAALLDDIDRIEAQLHLSGTLAAPRYMLRSQLGEELAAGLNRALDRELTRRQEDLVQQANHEIEAQLTQLQQELVSKHRNILKTLEIGDEQLGQLRHELLSRAGGVEGLIGRGRKLLFK